MTGVWLLTLAKAPLAGRVKTRLCPPFTPEQAAALARAALQDTLAAVLATPDVRPLLVLDGPPGDWLPTGLDWTPQAPGGLDARIAAALDLVAGEPAVLIGMDTPQLTPALLTAAAATARPGQAGLGPALDGGWWGLALGSADGELVRSLPMSTDQTGAAQRARLQAAGLQVVELPTLRDVDTAADADAVAALAPAGRFAGLLAELSRSGAA